MCFVQNYIPGIHVYTCNMYNELGDHAMFRCTGMYDTKFWCSCCASIVFVGCRRCRRELCSKVCMVVMDAMERSELLRIRRLVAIPVCSCNGRAKQMAILSKLLIAIKLSIMHWQLFTSTSHTMQIKKFAQKREV
jgi:hypothetical protein